MDTQTTTAEIPATFMRSFYIGTRLRWYMRTMQWPKHPVYTDMLDSFEKAFGHRMGGIRADAVFTYTRTNGSSFSYDSKKEKVLSDNVYELLLNSINNRSNKEFTSTRSETTGARTALHYLHYAAQSVSDLRRDGVRFSTAIAGKGDSHILFALREAHRPTAIIAGQIEDIFYHQRTQDRAAIVEPFVLVNAYSTLSSEHASRDPFRYFPDLNTRLYYNTIDRKYLVPFEDVISHFAGLVYTPSEIGRECMIVRSLDRVKIIFHTLA